MSASRCYLYLACLFLALSPEINAAAQTTPAGMSATNAPHEAGAKDTLNFQTAPVIVVLDAYEKLSGKHLIHDVQEPGVPPVTVNCTGLEKDAALKLISGTLLLNGVALIPVDDQTLKVVTVGTNKNPRSEGIRLYTNAADLPTDAQIVSYYMPLDHISPQEAAGIFLQVAPPHTYGGYVPAPGANGVILTEDASVIRELIDLQKQIDVNRNVLPPPRPSAPGPGTTPRGPHPHHHPFLLLLLLIVAFVAGYFVARFRFRRPTV